MDRVRITGEGFQSDHIEIIINFVSKLKAPFLDVDIISLFCFLLDGREPGKHQAVSEVHLEAMDLERDKEESIPQH